MIRLFAIAFVLGLVSTTPARAQDDLKDRVAKAIAAGQKYLKDSRAAGNENNLIGREGVNAGALIGLVGGNGSGTPCLTGLALIESGLDGKDPVVAAIGNSVRQSFMNSKATYEIALMIMFLDRLANKQDEPIIQFLTLRLMSGQSSQGHWGYTCDGLLLDPVQSRQLQAELVREVRLVTPEAPGSTPKPKKETRPRDDEETPKKDKPAEPKKSESKPEPKARLHPALEKIAAGIRPGGGTPSGLLSSGDHSNTQFATVGLWCGRRHGVEVGEFLRATEKHYRDCQVRDGGWTYSPGGGTASPSMTCAGLMGLAMGFGSKNLDGKGGTKADPDAIAADKNVEAGLKYLGTFLGAAGDQRDGGSFRANELTSDLYFMWSLERVGMAFGLQTIGKLDWYDWGARVLVSSQRNDGSWHNQWAHHGSPENATAFALLFLSRSNLLSEVSTSMRGRVKDPGTGKLVSGGDLSKIIGESGAGKTSPKSAGSGATRPKGDNPGIVSPADKGGKLANDLVKANATERAELLKQYRDTKGGEYTDALARAATKMSGEALAQVRDALAHRLGRMTVSTLIECMKDGDRELRRAGALAAGTKPKDRMAEVVPTLIKLIGDDEPMVVQAARASLKALSDQDHGPESGAAPGERGKALIAWRTWWESQKR